MDILSRLKEVISFSGLSVRAFAIKCGISQKTLDNQIKGLRGLSLETTVSILHAFPEISSEWFMRGEGQMMINKTGVSPDMERLSKLVDTITTLQDAINAKNDIISTLNERIKQLENQLNQK